MVTSRPLGKFAKCHCWLDFSPCAHGRTSFGKTRSSTACKRAVNMTDSRPLLQPGQEDFVKAEEDPSLLSAQEAKSFSGMPDPHWPKCRWVCFWLLIAAALLFIGLAIFLPLFAWSMFAQQIQLANKFDSPDAQGYPGWVRCRLRHSLHTPLHLAMCLAFLLMLLRFSCSGRQRI